MPIPAFTADGILPIGIYDCTLNEIKEEFSVKIKSIERDQLWNNLETFIGEVRNLGFVSVVYIDGGFTTNKPVTGDVDVAIVLPEKNAMRANLVLAEQIKNFLNNFDLFHADAKTRLKVDVYPNIPPVDPWENDFSKLFQYIGPKDAIRLGLKPKDKKGILRVAL